VAIKGKLAGWEFGRAGELVSEVTHDAYFISHATFANVICEWEQWVQKCIDMKGDYVDRDVY
jgi:hypothetical protein